MADLSPAELASRRYEAAMARLVPQRINPWPFIDHHAENPAAWEWEALRLDALRAALIAAGEAASAASRWERV